MDVDRDPTDVGLPRLPDDPGELESMAEAARRARLERFRAERDAPAARPASERVIERARALAGRPRSRTFHRLRQRCGSCRAEVGQWCRRGARGAVVGHLCATRGDTPNQE